jgi:hypothetical protein
VEQRKKGVRHPPLCALEIVTVKSRRSYRLSSGFS